MEGAAVASTSGPGGGSLAFPIPPAPPLTADAAFWALLGLLWALLEV